MAAPIFPYPCLEYSFSCRDLTPVPQWETREDLCPSTEELDATPLSVLADRVALGLNLPATPPNFAVALTNLARSLHKRSPSARLVIPVAGGSPKEFGCGDLYIEALRQNPSRLSPVAPKWVDQPIKWVAIGTGTESLLRRFAGRPFDDPGWPSGGVTQLNSKVLENFPFNLNLQIQDSISSIAHLLFCRGVLICFDLSSLDSFANLEKQLDELKDLLQDEFRTILVGTNGDLPQQVPQPLIDEFVEAKRVDYFAVSAKTGDGVSDLLAAIIEEYLDYDEMGETYTARHIAEIGLNCCRHYPSAFVVHRDHPKRKAFSAFRETLYQTPLYNGASRIRVSTCELPKGLFISEEQWFHEFGLSVLSTLAGVPFPYPELQDIDPTSLVLSSCRLWNVWPEFLRWFHAHPDTIKSLDLSYNNLECEVLLPLKTELRNKPSLELLIFDGNCIPHAVSLEIARDMLDLRLVAYGLELDEDGMEPGELNLANSGLERLPEPRPSNTTPTTILVLTNNKISDLSGFRAGKFSSVTILHLSFNSIRSIDYLLNLTYLNLVNLSHNKLESLPLRLGQAWPYLDSLNLSHNLLASVAEITSLARLETLDVSSNRLNSLPRNIPPKLSSLSVRGNPLFPPFDILLQASLTQETALAFLRDLRDKSTKTWRQIKVVTAGKAGVGKTHLTKRIQGLSYGKNQSTDGMEVNLLKKVKLSPTQEVDLCIYDLGGQEVFYPTHQFFLSGKAIYLIVFDTRNPDFANIEYWIRTVKGKQFQGVQVILVGTHIDKVSSAVVNSTREELKRAFARLLSPIPFNSAFVDCTSTFIGPGVSELKTLLLRLAESSHIISQEVPSFYHDTFELVSTRSNEYNFVYMSEFKSLFAKLVTTEASLHAMTTFLHEAGVITWYDQPELRDVVVINPQWLADLMACLVSFKVKWSNGKVTLNDLQIAWKKYPQKHHSLFITLMEKFEILFQLAPESWAIPCMLPEKKPDYVGTLVGDFDLKGPIPTACFKRHRIFHFEFVPRGLFPQLFVRLMHLDHVHHEGSWFNGIILRDSGADESPPERVLIEMTQANELRVTAISPAQSTTTLFEQVLAAADGLFASHYQNWVDKIKSEAACNHCLARAHANPDDEIHMIDSHMLEFAFVNGLTSVTCPGNLTSLVPLPDLCPDICLAKLPLCSQNEIEIEEEIGKGASGVVLRGKYKGQNVAIKGLNPDNETFRDWQHEVLMMSRFDHRNVVKLHGAMVGPLRMVMELCSLGDLHSFLSKPHNQHLSWRKRSKLLLDIAKGVLELHSAKPPIIHRDLRSPNIFITESGGTSEGKSVLEAKVGDLGLSRQAATNIATVLHSWQWVAPETQRGDLYDKASDVYSFGMICWHLAHPASWPFDDCPDEYKNSRTFTVAKTEVEARRHNLAQYRANPQVYSLEEKEDGSVVVTEVQFNEIRVKRAIAEGLRPKFVAPDCPAWVKTLATQCWATTSKHRPDFGSIVETITASMTVSAVPNKSAACAATPTTSLPREDVFAILDKAKLDFGQQDRVDTGDLLRFLTKQLSLLNTSSET